MPTDPSCQEQTLTDCTPAITIGPPFTIQYHMLRSSQWTTPLHQWWINTIYCISGKHGCMVTRRSVFNQNLSRHRCLCPVLCGVSGVLTFYTEVSILLHLYSTPQSKDVLSHSTQKWITSEFFSDCHQTDHLWFGRPYGVVPPKIPAWKLWHWGPNSKVLLIRLLMSTHTDGLCLIMQSHPTGNDMLLQTSVSWSCPHDSISTRHEVEEMHTTSPSAEVTGNTATVAERLWEAELANSLRAA